MTRLSLRKRSLLTAVVVLLVFVPAALFTMDNAYISSLIEAKRSQMRLLNLALISEFEVDDNRAVMPDRLFDEDLNLPSSGFYGFIQKEGEVFWQSGSALELEDEPTLFPPPVGQEYFLSDFGERGQYFLYAFSAEFETKRGFRPVSFYIMHNKAAFDTQHCQFMQTLWRWFAMLSFLLLGLVLFSMQAALSPVQRIIKQISKAETGEIERIEQQYPPELESLKHSINHLIATEQEQRARYKNSLSNLAHSLKTPVAVIAGTDKLPPEVKEPLNQINHIIQRQLVRASAGSSGWHEGVNVAPVASKLVKAMQKVYRDKSLHIKLEVDSACRFAGDKTDLMELLGNIIDNACKAANSQVNIAVKRTSQWLSFIIEDDGPGIADEDKMQLLRRGARLDTYQEGQGIGMAIVSDLVAIYQGRLGINNSALGGACFHISFPV